MKDNIITIDWKDEVLAKTALTHAGKLCEADAEPEVAKAAKSVGSKPGAAKPIAKVA
jgi:H+-translocating NAD(P) transhydrogenase subunit alpha